MEKVKERITHYSLYVTALLKWLAVGALVGGVGGFVGALFHLGVDCATNVRLAHPWILYLLPLGGVVIALLYRLCRLEGAGTNAVIESVHFGKKIPTLLVPLIFVSTVITHLCGGSAGREGAALQIGGGIGYALKTAISQGAKRGLFSNEAGMGSTPHAHALANVKSPHEQGTVAMIGVFIDTFVVLTMTALVVISTLYAGNGPLAHGAVDGISKTNMAQLAFSSVFGDTLGNAFVAICLLFFAFSTIVGWNLFGRINVNYLFGKKANLAYSIIAIIFIFLGSCLSNDLVWELTDMFNQLMVIPNVIALLALGGLVAASAKAGNSETLENVKK